MRLNWLAFNYRQWDGYGRYSTRMIQALERAGVAVTFQCEEIANMPAWMQERLGMQWHGITVSCLPPYYVQRVPGRHWLLTMTEGSKCPKGWAEQINDKGIERLIVPCQHNADAFARGGVKCPISVIPGGTAPDEFPLRTTQRDPSKPYTFLALADRGDRKGWNEVYQAFFSDAGFGPTTTGIQDVRLIIKYRPGGSDMLDFIVEKCTDIDPRITFLRDDVADMRDLYALADCFVIPSRCEGWGMPHREAAMMGVPVITQAHGGTDDGHTHEWAMVIEKGVMQPIPHQFNDHLLGEWRVADVAELAVKMRHCYERPWVAEQMGKRAAKWLRANQTWSHSANALLQVLQQEGALEREREYA